MKSRKPENAGAHSLSKTLLTKNDEKTGSVESSFSDVKTGHRTPDTEHLEKKNGLL